MVVRRPSPNRSDQSSPAFGEATERRTLPERKQHALRLHQAAKSDEETIDLPITMKEVDLMLHWTSDLLEAHLKSNKV